MVIMDGDELEMDVEIQYDFDSLSRILLVYTNICFFWIIPKLLSRTTYSERTPHILGYHFGIFEYLFMILFEFVFDSRFTPE